MYTTLKIGDVSKLIRGLYALTETIKTSALICIVRLDDLLIAAPNAESTPKSAARGQQDGGRRFSGGGGLSQSPLPAWQRRLRMLKAGESFQSSDSYKSYNR